MRMSYIRISRLRLRYHCLKKAMLSLNERERQIIELRFGVNRVENKELTQKEVADILGISQSYISRLGKKNIGKIEERNTENGISVV